MSAMSNAQRRYPVVSLDLREHELAAQGRVVQASADRLQSITDSAPIGIFRTDAEDRFVYTNPRWTAITGIPSEDAAGRDWESLLASMIPVGRTVEMLDVTADSAGPACRFELRSGSTSRIVQVTSEPLRDPLGEIAGHVGTLADVTAEVSAAAERSRFRALVQNSTDVVAVFDEFGRCTYVSPRVLEVTGFSQAEVTGTRGLSFIHPDDLGIVATHLEGIASVPDATKTVEVRTRTKAGGWIWVEIRAANRLHDPAIQGIVLHFHDITPRREAVDERLLLLDRHKDLSDQLRMLLDSTGEGIFGVDDTGVCTFMNRTGAILLGGAADQFVGQNMHRLTHHSYPDGSPYPSEDCPVYKGLLTGQPAKVTGEVVWRLDGTTIPADFSSYPIVGRDGGAVVVFQDVTHRRGMEEELRQSEMLFRGAFDAAQLGIALISADGLTYVDVNRALCEMLGYSKEEMLALNWRQITHPDDVQRNTAEFQEFLEGRQDVGRQTKRYVRQDGNTVWAEVSDSIVRGPDGVPLYFVTHVNDVTERKVAALEKQKLETQLVQAQKMEAIGQLAGGIAHDFNNILSVILNYAEFASEGLVLGDERLADMQQISEAGERAAALVHQLLAFSRKETVQAVVIDLNELVTATCQMLERFLGENIEIDFQPVAGLPTVLADPGRIEQVLLNLAVNARDAMPDGGRLRIAMGTLSVGKGDTCPLAPGDYVSISVTDSGIGMTLAIASRVFEPFFTTKPLGEGTGMGLSSAYGIVEQAGGHLSVESRPGIGSTFTLYLPSSEDLPVANDGRAGKLLGRGSETILLVEDEDVVRGLVTRILRQQGYDVVPCSSGTEALDYCKLNFNTIDLLLTDVVMPKMSGKEVSERASSICPGLMTLFMSGYADESIAQRGLPEANGDLIAKPFRRSNLLGSVRRVLDSKVAG